MKNRLIQVKNIKKYYRDGNRVIKALDGVSLDLFEGEIVGLLGVNGAGKTTLSSILATVHPPTEGDVLLNGKSIYNDINTYRRLIGFCPQKPNLIADLTVKQNLIFAGRYFELPKHIIEHRVEELISIYGLENYVDTKHSTLSGGYRQRVLIARSLVHNPKIVIFDEPTVGLDPHIRHNLWEIISNLRKEKITVILTTHYLDEAEFLSDRVCMLDKGLVKVTDTPENLMCTFQTSRLEDVFIKLMHEEPK